MIYLLTAIGLPPGGSSTVHIYTQTIHRTTQNKQYIEQHINATVLHVDLDLATSYCSNDTRQQLTNSKAQFWSCIAVPSNLSSFLSFPPLLHASFFLCRSLSIVIGSPGHVAPLFILNVFTGGPIDCADYGICICVCVPLKLREREKKRTRGIEFLQKWRDFYSAPNAKKYLSNAVRLRDSNTV
jgi:hypothetical protein